VPIKLKFLMFRRLTQQVYDQLWNPSHLALTLLLPAVCSVANLPCSVTTTRRQCGM